MRRLPAEERVKTSDADESRRPEPGRNLKIFSGMEIHVFVLIKIVEASRWFK